MANNGNLPLKENTDSTSNYFNNYFNTQFTTSPDINDVITGYFQKVTGDADAGRTLASTVIYTALSNGIEPMSLIDEFRKLKTGQVVEIKTPMDQNLFVSTYTSYDDIVANASQYSNGTFFYNTLTNTFYQSNINQNEDVTISQVTNYKADRVILGPGQYVYNYFEISTKKEADELTPYLTVLLNTNRVGTSLLGLSNSPKINKYVQRAILP